MKRGSGRGTSLIAAGSTSDKGMLQVVVAVQHTLVFHRLHRRNSLIGSSPCIPAQS